MNLKEAELIAERFLHLKNKKIVFEDATFRVNEIDVQLTGNIGDSWRPVMICTEIDMMDQRKKVFDALFTLSFDVLKNISVG